MTFKIQPSVWGVTILLVTVFLGLPLGLLYLIKSGHGTMLEMNDRNRAQFMAPEHVRANTGRKAMDAHLNVVKVRDILWNLDQKGKDLFGPWHSWEIPDFRSPGTFENCAAPYHPDFLVAWKKAEKLHPEKADVVLRDYFFIRVFYSELSDRLKQLATKLKTEIRDLPAGATLDFEMEANENLQASLFAEKETLRPQRILDEVISPFVRPL